MAAGFGGWYNAPYPFLAMVFRKKIIRMLESLLLDEEKIYRDEAEPLGLALIDEFNVIVGLRGFFTGPSTLQAHFPLFV